MTWKYDKCYIATSKRLSITQLANKSCSLTFCYIIVQDEQELFPGIATSTYLLSSALTY